MSESILDRLEERATGMARQYSERRPVVVDVAEHKTGNVTEAGFGRRHEYVLTAAVRSHYWANPAEREKARTFALRTLASLLYRDVIEELLLIQGAIVEGEPTEALRRVAELHERLRS